jgi:uncharacterized membrane protein
MKPPLARPRRLLAGSLAAMLANVAVLHAAPPTAYTVTLLPKPETHATAVASDLNNAGISVGSGLNQDGWFSAVRWSADGTPEDMGPGLGLEYSEWIDLNEAGVLVGVGAKNANTDVGKPLLFDPAVSPDPLVHLEPLVNRPQALTVARGVNDLDIVVGSGRTLSSGPFDANNPFEVAVMWDSNGDLQTLGSLGDIAWALDMNNNGLVIGRTSTPIDTFASGFLWDAQNGMRLLNGVDGQTDLGAVAFDINNSDVYVGTTSSGAAIWFQESQATALPLPEGTLLSEANGLNESNEVVGRVSDGAQLEAVLWIDGQVFVITDLVGNPTLHFHNAYDINDQGQILARVTDSSGPEVRVLGALLTPIACPTDLDADGGTDLDDLTLLLQAFQGAGVPSPGGDVDGDGDTDLDDLTLLLMAFGTLCN